MARAIGLIVVTLIIVISASGLVIARPADASFTIQNVFDMNDLRNFAKRFLNIAPTYDLSETFAVRSESVAELNSGRDHVEKYIQGYKEEIDELEEGIEGIDDTASRIVNIVRDYEGRTEHVIEEVSEEVKKAPETKLKEFESQKVDVAETIYEGNVPIQKDIFTHSKELYKDKDDPDSFGVLPI